MRRIGKENVHEDSRPEKKDLGPEEEPDSGRRVPEGFRSIEVAAGVWQLTFFPLEDLARKGQT